MTLVEIAVLFIMFGALIGCVFMLLVSHFITKALDKTLAEITHETEKEIADFERSIRGK